MNPFKKKKNQTPQSASNLKTVDKTTELTAEKDPLDFGSDLAENEGKSISTTFDQNDIDTYS